MLENIVSWKHISRADYVSFVKTYKYIHSSKSGNYYVSIHLTLEIYLFTELIINKEFFLDNILIQGCHVISNVSQEDFIA